jgi:hypothetical protein
MSAEMRAASKSPVAAALVGGSVVRLNVGTNLLDHSVQRLNAGTRKVGSSFFMVRMLDEIVADLTQRAGRLYDQFVASWKNGGNVNEDVTAELIATEGQMMEATELKLALLENVYSTSDLVVKDQDRRIRLLEALLRETGTNILRRRV